MPVYTWNAVPTATWYLLWVNDSVQSAKVQQWVTAAQVGCAEGTGTCSVDVEPRGLRSVEHRDGFHGQ